MKWRDNQFLQALAVVVAAYILWQLKTVVIILFVAFLLTTIGYPLVAWMKKYRLPTVLAILLPIIIVVGGLGILFYLLLPPFLHRIGDFASQLPSAVTTISRELHLSIDTAHLNSYVNSHLSNISNYAFKVTGTALKVLAGVISVLVLTIYWLGSYERVKAGVLGVFRHSARRRAQDVWQRIEAKLQLWIKAHLMLNTAVALMVWISMSLLRVPFAELLALTAFLLEIIPTAGPILAAVPGVLLGLSQSPLRGLLVIIIYTIIQQIENHILSPLLLGKTVDLHPIIIIASLLIGAEVYGILGVLLAVPAALCISAVVDSFRDSPKSQPIKSAKV